jgi:hypothetical protein
MLLLAFTLFATLLLGVAATGGASAAAIEQSASAPAAGLDRLSAQAIITPSKDNTIYEGATALRSNGAGHYMFAGKNGQGAIQRALLAFDLSDALPTGATLVSVTLRLNSSTPRSGAYPIRLYRVLSDWGEGTSRGSSGEGGGAPATTGDATWLHTFFDTDLWSAAGGDFVATASATTTVNAPGPYTWSTPEMMADVEAWLADPATNFGWILVGNETTNGSGRRFDTRDNNLAANHPQLILTYSLPPGEQHLLYLPFVGGE